MDSLNNVDTVFFGKLSLIITLIILKGKFQILSRRVQEETEQTIQNFRVKMKQIGETSEELTENVENTKSVLENFLSDFSQACTNIEIIKNPSYMQSVMLEFWFDFCEEIYKLLMTLLKLTTELCSILRGLSVDLSRLATSIYVSTSQTKAIVLGINIVFNIG